MSETQAAVVDAVRRRGYLDPKRWTKRQLLARQVLKFGEEFAEFAAHIVGLAPDTEAAIERMGELCRRDFHERGEWHPVTASIEVLDVEAMCRELGDMTVVDYTAAALLGTDAEDEARRKATADVGRGVGV